MKKTRNQKQILRRYKLIPIAWTVINERKGDLLVMNWLTGEFRMLDK